MVEAYSMGNTAGGKVNLNNRSTELVLLVFPDRGTVIRVQHFAHSRNSDKRGSDDN